jgi:small GTP-binding protein
MQPLKIVLIGDSGVGKTCFCHRYIHGQIPNNEASTIGASFFKKTETIENNDININVWDTAGQERYLAICPMYFREAHGCLCLFDLTEKSSFTNIYQWITKFSSTAHEYAKIIIVANKSDTPEAHWQVSIDDIEKLKKNSIMGVCDVIYASAYTNDNVTNAFTYLIGQILNEPEFVNTKKNDIVLHKEQPNIIIDSNGCYC